MSFANSKSLICPANIQTFVCVATCKAATLSQPAVILNVLPTLTQMKWKDMLKNCHFRLLKPELYIGCSSSILQSAT